MSQRLIIPASKTINPRYGYIYLISEPYGLYKIGQSINVALRLQVLQQATPYNLTVVDTFEVQDRFSAEQYIHGVLAAYHVRNEWFNLPNKTYWYDTLTQYQEYLRQLSIPKPVPTPTFDHYNEDIRAELTRRLVFE